MHNGHDFDIDALLDEAQFPQREVPICLRGDLVSEIERLDQELAAILRDEDAARESGAASLATGGKGREVAEQIEALQAKMQGSTITLVLRALPRARFRALIDEHPPRKDEEGGVLPADLAGINSATFYDALARECLASPELTDAQWRRLLSKLSDRQWQKLADTAWEVNRSEVDVPFSFAASRLTRGSGTE
jgi:hypothetical protein